MASSNTGGGRRAEWWRQKEVNDQRQHQVIFQSCLKESLSSRCMRDRSFHRWTVASRSAFSCCMRAFHRMFCHLARCSGRQSSTVCVGNVFRVELFMQV